MRLVKVARVALKKDGGAIAQLDLSGKRKDSLSGSLKQNSFIKMLSLIRRFLLR